MTSGSIGHVALSPEHNMFVSHVPWVGRGESMDPVSTLYSHTHTHALPDSEWYWNWQSALFSIGIKNLGQTHVFAIWTFSLHNNVWQSLIQTPKVSETHTCTKCKHSGCSQQFFCESRSILINDSVFFAAHAIVNIQQNIQQKKACYSIYHYLCILWNIFNIQRT